MQIKLLMEVAIIETNNLNLNKNMLIGDRQRYTSEIIALIGPNRALFDEIARRFNMSNEDLNSILLYPNSINLSFLDEILAVAISLKKDSYGMTRERKQNK